MTSPFDRFPCIIQMDIPFVKKIKKKWIIAEVKKYLVTHNRAPTQEEFVHIVKQKYPTKNTEQVWGVRIKIDLTEEQAMAFASCESMNDGLDYRSPETAEECPVGVYRFVIARGDWTCSICLGSETDRQVTLKTCSCTYHRKCIRKSYLYSHKCPVCRLGIE